MATNDDRKLDFLVAGVQKGGTTSLFTYLSAHPELCAPFVKELHFFNDDNLDWDNPDYKALHSAFRSNSPAIRFEATPAYLFWPGSIKRIRDYNSEIKIILLFRDPILRAWSHWKMEYARHAEQLPFHAAIRQGRWRMRATQRWGMEHRSFSYVERGFYAEQMRRALEIFPREQFLFLKSSDLSRNPARVLSRIANFVGIADFPELVSAQENTAPEIRYPSRLEQNDVLYLRDIFIEDTLEFATIANIDVGDWLTTSNLAVMANG